MKPRFFVKWTNIDGYPHERTFTNKIQMIKFVMMLAFKGRFVKWEEGAHVDQGFHHGYIEVPSNIGTVDELKVYGNDCPRGGCE